MHAIKQEKIGILGGSGAFGTSYLFNKILQISVCQYGAKRDEDFPYLVIYNSPLEKLNHLGNSIDYSLNPIIKQLKEMESIGCTTIVIACNTLHEHYQKLKSFLLPTTQFVNMIELLETYINKKFPHILDITILSSEHSKKIALHQQYLKNKNVIYPNDNIQKHLNDFIEKGICGNNSCSKIFNEIVCESIIDNEHLIVIGCTELSILNETRESMNVVDTCEILAKFITQLHFSTFSNTNYHHTH